MPQIYFLGYQKYLIFLLRMIQPHAIVMPSCLTVGAAKNSLHTINLDKNSYISVHIIYDENFRKFRIFFSFNFYALDF